ncbi:Ldh family oxidoreductase [Streptomyces cavernae]|uniref:Ldh family oxidoreductase n=1 Tax=Streptomyces cavernae TaxID=2259034 RepID=UPI000FEB921D|nr:Ldh family oxidoreductase [Streptomyces cavernae]
MTSACTDRPTRVVVITGAPGVGKTEAGRRLVRRYRCPAAFIDTDSMADVYPWRADERTYSLISRNLRACLASYREWGARIVVISGVLLPGRALDPLADLLTDQGLHWVFYGLRATAGELAARIRSDTKVQEADGRLSWAYLDAEVPTVPGVQQIDTSGTPLDTVVDRIAEAEAAGLPACTVRLGPGSSPRPSPWRPPATGPTGVAVAAVEAAGLARAALVAHGMSETTAMETARELVAAELAGQPSHGLLRVPEYVASLDAGETDPRAEPVVHRTGPASVLIDGRRAPGTVVRRSLVAELARATAGTPVVAGLRAAGHLGRLGSLAQEVARHGLVLLGFVNFCGAGRKVVPSGGTTGFWATNPIVLACPAPPGPPLVVDISTSAASEGTIRAALLAGRKVPAGLLVGPDRTTVTDPGLLYRDPPGAALLPLGGVAAHKGHALAALVEVLAGIVAGSGHAAAPQDEGNGGLFVAFPVTSLGQSEQAIAEAVAALERHLGARPAAPGDAPPRLPGRARPRQQPVGGELTVPAQLWQRIRELARSTPSPLSAGENHDAINHPSPTVP